MNDDTHPFLMHKRTFAVAANRPAAQARYPDEFVPITAEQARALEADPKGAAARILREVVARDNASALAEAEALAAKPAPADAPAPAAPDGPAPAPADTPWYLRPGATEAAAKAADEPPPAEVRQTVGAEEDYASLSLERLRALAAERGIDGSKMSRRQLAAVLAAETAEK